MKKLEKEFRHLLKRYKDNQITEGIVIDWLKKKKKWYFEQKRKV